MNGKPNELYLMDMSFSILDFPMENMSVRKEYMYIQ